MNREGEAWGPSEKEEEEEGEKRYGERGWRTKRRAVGWNIKRRRESNLWRRERERE